MKRPKRKPTVESGKTRISFRTTTETADELQDIAKADYRTRASLVQFIFERGLEAFRADGILTFSGPGGVPLKLESVRRRESK